MTSGKSESTFLFAVCMIIYMSLIFGAVWVVANSERRISRLEKIIVNAGLWPAGEPAPKGVEQDDDEEMRK